MKKIKIYLITDKFENPIYIGKTINSLNKRKIDHRKKYGKNILIFLLDEVDNERKIWKFWESYWISQFKQWGFKLENNNEGGGGPENHSEESRLKMSLKKRPETSLKLKGKLRPDVSERFKGNKLSEETCQKISKSKIGHSCYKNPERGRKISESNKDNYKKDSKRNNNISKKLLGRKADWVKKLSKPILQFDLQNNPIKEWSSISEAIKETNIKGIGNVLRNRAKKSGGYFWKYK